MPRLSKLQEQFWILRRNNGPLPPLYHFESSNNDLSRIDELYAADKTRAEKRTGSNHSGSHDRIENASVGESEMTY